MSGRGGGRGRGRGRGRGKTRGSAAGLDAMTQAVHSGMLGAYSAERVDEPAPTYPEMALPKFQFGLDDEFTIRAMRWLSSCNGPHGYKPSRADYGAAKFRTAGSDAAAAGADESQEDQTASLHAPLLKIRPQLARTPILPKDIVKLTKRRRTRATGVVPGASKRGVALGAPSALRGRSGSFASSVGDVVGDDGVKQHGEGDGSEGSDSEQGLESLPESSEDEEDYNDYAEERGNDDDDDGAADDVV